MLRHWLAEAGDRQRWESVKRFTPRLWTVAFPRPMTATLAAPGADELTVTLAFVRRNDLAGLVWESVDRWSHPLLGYETRRDYRGCVWRFRWQAGAGVKPLDAVNGPTLTVEGRDAAGVPRTWYVRLWNYAVGTPWDAVVTLDFDALAGGFLHPAEADPLWAGDIDRLSISLVAADYDGVEAPLAAAVETAVTLSGMRCDGPGSVLRLGDAFVPAHGVAMASGYDDSCHQAPERLVEQWIALGYRGLVNHYVGMSHYYAVAWDGSGYRVNAARTLGAPAAAWHAALARACAAAGLGLIWSLSFEIFAANAPLDWVQRKADGSIGLTGWQPPSALVSPCHAAAVGWLCEVAAAFADMALAAGLPLHVQVGEPWWWVGADHAPCFYDPATRAAWAAERAVPMPVVTDVRVAVDAGTAAMLDWLGGKLAAATFAVRDRVRALGAVSYLLFYAPQVLGVAELHRANMPAAWAAPAWDVLQLEDYDFVTGGDALGMARARDAVTGALGYPAAGQHYLSGFVLRGEERFVQWPRIVAAAGEARARGVAAVFLWAWPQVARDGLTLWASGEDGVGTSGADAFHDVRFPLELGYNAAGGPEFSTQVALMASGHEQRNSAWASARLRFDAGLGVRSEADLVALVAFYRARRGPAHGFRFRDPLDSSSAADNGAPAAGDQWLGVGDGVRSAFALVKRYGEGGDCEVRRVTRAVPGTVRVAVDGVPVTDWLLGDGGVVELAAAPAAGAVVSAGFRFDVPVRFAEDRLDVSITGWRVGELPSVPLVELREAP